MNADLQTIVWNRAAVSNGGPTPRPGDAALAHALRLHGLVMSGGLDHALDVLTPEDFASAADGFRYLRLDHVAGLVSDALSPDPPLILAGGELWLAGCGAAADMSRGQG